MAITQFDSAIGFTPNNYVDLDSGTSATATSDVMTIDATTFEASVQVKADYTTGTGPDPGDTVEVYILYSTDGTTYDTSGHGALLGVLDTDAEDPATATFPILTSPANFKLYVSSNAGADTIRVTPRLTEKRG